MARPRAWTLRSGERVEWNLDQQKSIPVMRLTELQIDTIRVTAAEIFGPDAEFWLLDSVEVPG